MSYPIKKRLKLHGFDISIENPQGSVRRWYDPHGKETGSTRILHDYGYIRGTKGTDGDHVDVYVGPDRDSDVVFVVNQMKKPDFKEFDEQKVMLGFKDADAAKKAYLRQYNDPRFFGSMKEMSVTDFRAKVLDKEFHGKKVAQRLHTPSGAVFGGAAADSQVGIKEAAFTSKRQWRAAFAGQIPGFSKEKAKEWAHETPGEFKDLPDRAPAEKGKPTLRSKSSGLAHTHETMRGLSHAAVHSGEKVELEHTKDMDTARQIAIDHLHERPDYYAKLKKMEASPVEKKASGLMSPRDIKIEKAKQMLGQALPGAGLGALVGGLSAGAEGTKESPTTPEGYARGALVGGTIGGLAGVARGHFLQQAGDARYRAMGLGQQLREAQLGADPERLIITNAAGDIAPLTHHLRKKRRGEQMKEFTELTKSMMAPAMGFVGARRFGALAGAPEQEKMAFSLSPTALSHLQHAGVGAGIGALAGGVGGAMHADPEHRGSGVLRGALAGAGLGALGGAGISSIKAHGAEQLATLRGQAQQAEQAAMSGHQHVKDLERSVFEGRGTPSIAPAAPTPAPAKPTPMARRAADSNATGAVEVRPLTLGQSPSGAPSSLGKVNPYANTMAEHLMTPEAHGFKATQSAYQTGHGMVQGAGGEAYRAVPGAVPAIGHAPAAPAAAPAAPAAAASQFSGNLDVARQQATAAGGRAAALGNAANTLEQQHGVMNQAINRAGLVGAAAGTGLMGYMVAPREYGGVGLQPQQAPTKVAADVNELAAQIQKMKEEKAHEDRISKIDAGLDTLGIGVLAAPVLAHGAEAASKKLMLRGGRMGMVGNAIHNLAEPAHHFFERNFVPTELGGLALVAPGITHPLAHAIDRAVPAAPQAPMPIAPPANKLAAESVVEFMESLASGKRKGSRSKDSPQESPLEGVADLKTFSSIAQKVGALLAHEGGKEKVAVKLAGVGQFLWQNRRPIAGLAAVGAVGAGLYGAKKGIDVAADAVTSHGQEPMRFSASQPGMRPPAPAYQPLGG